MQQAERFFLLKFVRHEGDATPMNSLVVLVVEDDLLIQSVIEEVLQDGGFATVMVETGPKALGLLRENPQHYRALVTDINLAGGTDGWQVAKHARESNPAIPVVYMTGAAAEQWASRGVPNSVLLSKPFAPAQLVTAISQLLNAAPLTPQQD
jgi:CheY-like chemotaxis protein